MSHPAHAGLSAASAAPILLLDHDAAPGGSGSHGDGSGGSGSGSGSGGGATAGDAHREVADRLTASDAADAVRQAGEAFERLRTEIAKVIVGQDEVVEQALIALFCRGHALVVGVPGLAKTLLISTIAKTLNLRFSRIQFTPDLMPSDITGTEVIEEDKSTGSRGLRFVRGPIFANVVLADEINRTPPKTQAALLEAMQEHQVTAGGSTYPLPEPFFVLATQNPIEQEGTYPLPEAQLDRFMFAIRISYPTAEQELEVVRRTTAGASTAAGPVMSGADVERVQDLVRQVPVADHVLHYVLAIVRATRVSVPIEEVVGGFGGTTGADPGGRGRGMKDAAGRGRGGGASSGSTSSAGGQLADALVEANRFARNYLSWGAGPRASQYIVLAAKAKAILEGSTHVRPDHVTAVIAPVLRHRLITNFNAEADGISSDDVVRRLLELIPSDRFTQEMTDPRLDAVLR